MLSGKTANLPVSVTSRSFRLIFGRIVFSGRDSERNVEPARILKSCGIVWFPAQARTITACHYSRDGSRVVTGSWDCSVKLWCASTGKIEHTLEGHTKNVTCCVISRDGTVIVSASDDRTAIVWGASTGEVRHRIKGHKGAVTSCAISADHTRVVTGSADRTARVWDTSKYAVLHRKSLRAAKKADIKRVAAQEAAAEVPSANLARTDPEDRLWHPGRTWHRKYCEDDSLHTAKLWYDPEDPNAKK